MTVTLEEFRLFRETTEARLDRLETASGQHAAKLSEQGGMLVSMDADISKIQVEFRAQRGLLQALHDTQSDHTRVLSEHTALLNQHTALLNQHTTALAEVRAGVQTIIGLLDPNVDPSAKGSNESSGLN